MRNSTLDELTMKMVILYQHSKRVGVTASETYYYAGWALAILGSIGGLIGLATMLHNRYLQVTSYVYHKVLMAANTVYCINWLGAHAAAKFALDPKGHRFHSYFLALYVGIIKRLLASGCGYIWLYMSLLISLERFIALGLPSYYKSFSGSFCCRVLVSVTSILSFTLHSWASLVEREVIFNAPNDTDATYYEWKMAPSRISPTVNVARNVLNSTVRMAFPILLTLFTGAAIGFYMRKKKGRQVTRSKRFHREQRSLFLLMVIVVVLAYIQVIPRESSRILNLTLPRSALQKTFSNSSVPGEARLRSLKVFLYVYPLLNVVMNFCTVLDRSVLFFLYFALNSLFRRATLQFLCACCLKYSKRCAERRPLCELVSKGDAADDEERKELLLLFSPQLVTNFNSVFSLTTNMCRGIVSMKTQRDQAAPALSKIAVRQRSRTQLLSTPLIETVVTDTVQIHLND